MQIKVFKSEQGRRVADAKVIFDEGDGLLAGTVLEGFSIMKGKDDELFVSLPARSYVKDGETRYYNFLRCPTKDDTAGLEKFKEAVLAEYNG